MCENGKKIGIRVVCNTCGWESGPYLFVVEGCEDYAKTSAIIETRLGHLRDTAVKKDGETLVHQVKFTEILQN